MPAPGGPRIAWPAPHRRFGLATHALVAGVETLPSRSRRLHVPDYYCHEVVQTWRRLGLDIRWYADDPRWTEPDWESLRPRPGDAVLAVNFFGVRAEGGWRAWRASHEDVVLVEDHSHDPLSPWARRSGADLAFASLRKTLPISDGALLWSPAGLPLPDAPPFDPSNGSSLKRDAMALKRDFLLGADVEREAFRARQLEGEATLLAGVPSAISPWSDRLLDEGLPVTWRERRRRNVRLLLDLISDARLLRPLFTSWRRGQAPFNVVLLAPTPRVRERVRAELIRRQIFSPVHWAQPSETSARARGLGLTILTVPADQRYGAADIRRVAAELLAIDAEARAG